MTPSSEPLCFIFVGQVVNLRPIVNRPSVGQPILAATGFQPALSARDPASFSHKRRSRQRPSPAHLNAHLLGAILSDSQRRYIAPSVRASAEARLQERQRVRDGKVSCGRNRQAHSWRSRLKAGCSQDSLPHKAGGLAIPPRITTCCTASGECESCTHTCVRRV